MVEYISIGIVSRDRRYSETLAKALLCDLTVEGNTSAYMKLFPIKVIGKELERYISVTEMLRGIYCLPKKEEPKLFFVDSDTFSYTNDPNSILATELLSIKRAYPGSRVIVANNKSEYYRTLFKMVSEGCIDAVIENSEGDKYKRHLMLLLNFIKRGLIKQKIDIAIWGMGQLGTDILKKSLLEENVNQIFYTSRYLTETRDNLRSFEWVLGADKDKTMAVPTLEELTKTNTDLLIVTIGDKNIDHNVKEREELDKTFYNTFKNRLRELFLAVEKNQYRGTIVMMANPVRANMLAPIIAGYNIDPKSITSFAPGTRRAKKAIVNFISQKRKTVTSQDVKTIVLGYHGREIPVMSMTTVAKDPLEVLLLAEHGEEINIYPEGKSRDAFSQTIIDQYASKIKSNIRAMGLKETQESEKLSIYYGDPANAVIEMIRQIGRYTLQPEETLHCYIPSLRAVLAVPARFVYQPGGIPKIKIEGMEDFDIEDKIEKKKIGAELEGLAANQREFMKERILEEEDLTLRKQLLKKFNAFEGKPQS